MTNYFVYCAAREWLRAEIIEADSPEAAHQEAERKAPGAKCFAVAKLSDVYLYGDQTYIANWDIAYTSAKHDWVSWGVGWRQALLLGIALVVFLGVVLVVA